MSVLNKIIEARKITLAKAKQKLNLNQLLERIQSCSSHLNFEKELKKSKKIQLIAEVKKASPSKGVIQKNFNPLEIAKAYQEGGASAISVLTETEFFLGSDSYLQEISTEVNLPTLRKDFIIDPYQVLEAKALGASAYLLIVDCLEYNQLKELLDSGIEQGLTALIEVHRKLEIEIALKAGARVLGINNRNLRSFETSLDVTKNLLPYIPKDRVVISESGIKTHQDLLFLESLGVDAVLVGETLVKSGNPLEATQKLLSKFL